MDYGLVENIPVVHVYPKLLCDDVGQLCMPCQLHGVVPVRLCVHVSVYKTLKVNCIVFIFLSP